MTDRMSSEPPQWPAGPFVVGKTHDDQQHEAWIREIERAPTRLRETVSGLSNNQLDTKYRNWTIRQIVHHLADSHMNAYVRFKLALTEERPTITPYDESRWSLLTDAQQADIEPSLQLLEGLHARWAYLLRSLTPDAFERSFRHPEKFYDREIVPLWHALAVYAWHVGHHTAQVEWVRKHKLSVPGGRSN